VNVGEFTTNISLSPYLKSQFIYFRASGMKPFARLYPFFADSDVSAICRPLLPFSGTYTTINGLRKSDASGNPLAKDPFENVYEYDYDGTTWGSAITADANGDAYGVLRIPPRIFRVGEIEFKLVDTPTLTLTGASTQASAIFYGTSLSLQKQKIDLQTRPSINNTQEIGAIFNIQQTPVNTVTNDQNVVQQPTIQAPLYSSDPYWGYNDGGGGDSSDSGSGSGGCI
jgi:hypothetical protein